MLLLKNEIKSIFKDAGLPEGITVNRVNKYVAITGPCGQPILTLTKIEVAARLTKAERAIIINDYIKPALTTNIKQIKAYIKLRQNTLAQDEYNKLSTKYKIYHGAYNTEYIEMRINNFKIRHYFKDTSILLVDSYSEMPSEKAITLLKQAFTKATALLPKIKTLLTTIKNQQIKLNRAKKKLIENCNF